MTEKVLTQDDRNEHFLDSSFVYLSEEARELVIKRLSELKEELASRDDQNQHDTLYFLNLQLLTLTKPHNHQ